MGILSSCIIFILAIKTFNKQIEIEHLYSRMSTHYGDTFSNISIIKSFALFSMKHKQLKKLTDNRAKKQYPIIAWWGTVISLTEILRVVVSIGVVLFGSFLFFSGEISI